MGIQSLDRAEILALLEAARAKRDRDWLMVLLAFSHGLRASEVVALRPDNFHKGKLIVQRLKGSELTDQPLIASENPLLDAARGVFEFLRKVPGNQRLFPITRQRFWQIVQEHAKAAGIAKHKRHPHVLKHSIAMQTIEKAGIHKVKKYLGHKSIASTGKYLEVTDDQASTSVQGSLSV